MRLLYADFAGEQGKGVLSYNDVLEATSLHRHLTGFYGGYIERSV